MDLACRLSAIERHARSAREFLAEMQHNAELAKNARKIRLPDEPANQPTPHEVAAMAVAKFQRQVGDHIGRLSFHFSRLAVEVGATPPPKEQANKNGKATEEPPAPLPVTPGELADGAGAAPAAGGGVV